MYNHNTYNKAKNKMLLIMKNKKISIMDFKIDNKIFKMGNRVSLIYFLELDL